ncbi:MFS transporter [Pseudomonas sp. SO81]|uniref:MFS transporter n=1 Tax=Pseudomonas sp. SO81 TaxID=2983246 RepID=UPI0025A4C61B|nr:MFS transporter [Pseudomonas sp. SO81]WJN58418.1 Permease, major facilitator superfamily [Pseudomonas sp. SO81]
MSPSETTGRPGAFLANFMLLAAFSGATIGMAKIITTLYAIEIGANALQLGIISAMESLGMVLLTLPAGFVIARFGARRVYFLASLGPMLLNLAIPLFGGWIYLAVARLLIGLCIPFRIVAMNSAFLRQLKRIGNDKAGWYRGSLTLGMGLLGPLLGNWLSGSTGFTLGFVVIGLCFGLMAVYSLGFWEAEQVEPSSLDVGAESGSMFSQVLAMLQNLEIAESCLIEMLSGATGALFGTFIILLAMDVVGLSQSQAVSLVMVQGLAAVLGLFGLGYLVERIGRRFAYVAGLSAAVLGLLLLGRAHGYALLAIGGVLLSTAASLVHLVNMAQLGEHAADKSKISGLFNLAGMLGSFSGALLGGVISQLVGLSNLFLAWIPLLLLVAGFCWLRKLRRAPAAAVLEG